MCQRLDGGDSRQYVRVFRRHVLEPLSAAETAAERTREEISIEIRAFDRFATRVQQLAPTTAPSTRGRRSITRFCGRDSPSASTDGVETRVCNAYRETVTSVPHYEDVYGESLEENLVAELGPELALVVLSNSDIPFTPVHRDALVTKVERVIAAREAFRDAISSELKSLAAARRSLTGIVDELDDVVVEPWYRNRFEDRLDGVVSDRQSELRSSVTAAGLDGHGLCDSLYEDEPWTYPVLVAAARLRNAVVVE